MNDLADEYIFNVDSPEITAPVKIDFQFKGIYEDITDSVNKLVNDIKQGGDETITTIMMAGMFIFSIVYLWRRV